MNRRGLRLKRSRAQVQDTSAQRLLGFQLRAVGLERFECEYRFARAVGREWQWDIAFVPELLAVEVDGGIWSRGAHGHPVTILRNMEKRNWGARLGWRVLAFSTRQVKAGEALAFIEFTLREQTGMLHGQVPSDRQPRRGRAARVPPAGAHDHG